MSRQTYMLRIDPDKTVTVKPYIDTLEALQEEVGGYIESVNLGFERMMVVNDDGKNIGLEYNPLASSIYPYGAMDHIVGPAIILKRCRKYDEDGDPDEYWDGYDLPTACRFADIIRQNAAEL